MPTNFRLAYNSDGLNYTDLFPRTSMEAIINGGNSYQIVALDVDIPVPSDSSITQTIAITTTQEMVDAVFRVYLISTGDQAEQDYATITQMEVQENQLIITRLYNTPSEEITVRLLFFEKGIQETGGGNEPQPPDPGPDPEPVTLVSIAVTTNPNKLDYNVGETFDSTGMVVTATYSDSHQEAVSGYTYSPTTALTEQDTTITITYVESDVTAETTLTITVTAVVVDPSETPVSLTLVSGPDETEYIGGEDVDLTGIQLRVQYADQSEKIVGPENVTYSLPEQVATVSTFATNSTDSPYSKPIIYSYTESGITVSCESTIIMQDEPDPILENNLWKMISKVSSESRGSEYWNIGDEKTLKMSGGYIGDDYIIPEGETADIYAVIIDFDHNSEIEGTGITFLLMGKDDETGHEIAFTGQYYQVSYKTYPNNKFFRMNFSSNTNEGGWKECDMRYEILGSTDIKGGDATNNCAINPVPNTLMSKLEENLRKYMKPMKIYTDNVGGPNNAPENVTPTIDYLPLFSADELYGTSLVNGYANSTEKEYTTGYYVYFNTVAKRIKYKYQDSGTASMYFLRSPFKKANISNSSSFCAINNTGSMYILSSQGTFGILPIFRI